ncbi:MAG: tetratricopeptide repeat protein [Phaeodactylibacter sp.]|nr:tetratricopeptide repeat protein [Phaeodactylibacter sp.]
MADNLNLQEKIDRFLEGEMEASERQSFEQEIQENPEARELLQLNQALAETLADQQETQLIEAIQSVRAARTSTGNTAKIVPFQTRLLRWAAIALVLIAVGIGFRYFVNPDTPETLFAANFEGKQMQVTEMSAATDALLQEGTERYNTGQYQAAAERLQSYLQAEPEHWEVQLYLGNALLQAGQADDARVVYQKIVSSGSSYAEPAEWQSALSFLKSGKTAQAKAALQSIADRPGHSYQKKASNLLKRLK